MKLISLIIVFRREVIDTVGMFDPAFIHDFGEDDFCMRLRRAGYKSILCGDTWVCHDHDFRNSEGKDPAEYQKSLDSGRQIFYAKYHEIDAWDDMNNFEQELLSPLDEVAINTNPVTLCVDVRCGTPVLEIRNRLRKRKVTDTLSYAFTTQAKYMFDLQSVALEVQCDKLNSLHEYYAAGTFDVIAVGEPINTYDKPILALQTLFGLLKAGGVLLFKVRNTDDYNTFLRTAGLGGVYDEDMPICFPIDGVRDYVERLGSADIKMSNEFHHLNKEGRNALSALLRCVNPIINDDDYKRLVTVNYCFSAVKPCTKLKF
jgi:SAM-dependent methyltransferase